jgi:hypothetical protein
MKPTVIEADINTTTKIVVITSLYDRPRVGLEARGRGGWGLSMGGNNPQTKDSKRGGCKQTRYNEDSISG